MVTLSKCFNRIVSGFICLTVAYEPFSRATSIGTEEMALTGPDLYSLIDASSSEYQSGNTLDWEVYSSTKLESGDEIRRLYSDLQYKTTAQANGPLSFGVYYRPTHSSL